MADWYPTAIQKLGNDAGSFVAGYPKRGVLHTTEGNSAAGAIGAYKNANSWPHFTVDKDGKVYQHIPISKAARSLENLSGGVETNRAGAIQIEVVGFASKPAWPPAQIESMRSLMRWIEAQTGIQPTGPAFGGPEQYGLKNPLEFTNEQWKSFNGWCGHQHVPENAHYDPGPINLQDLFPTPVQEIPIVAVNAPPVEVLTHPNWGFGYIIVTADGGVFTFGGAPFYGSLGGTQLNAPIVAAAVTSTGKGYKLIGRDGGDFNFGDSVGSGRVEYTGA